jgi:hypothetical protein
VAGAGSDDVGVIVGPVGRTLDLGTRAWWRLVGRQVDSAGAEQWLDAPTCGPGRVATAAGSLLAALGGGFHIFRNVGPQGDNVVPVEPAAVAQQPKFTSPLTREECGGNTNGLSGGFYDGLQKFLPAEE